MFYSSWNGRDDHVRLRENGYLSYLEISQIRGVIEKREKKNRL